MTTYKGFYWTTRDNERIGIYFTYQHDPITGAMINEVETKIIKKGER